MSAHDSFIAVYVLRGAKFLPGGDESLDFYFLFFSIFLFSFFFSDSVLARVNRVAGVSG